MNILEKIVASKRQEVDQARSLCSIADLEKRPLFKQQPLSLRDSLRGGEKTGIIAEYKRRSPSKGVINDQATVEEVTAAYARYGASGISVLTDTPFFGGSLKDLERAVGNQVPLLRKDFMIDPYQLVEAKAYGASVILLIAACLSQKEVKQLAKGARDLGLEVLLELHDASELDHICEEVDMVGINNRNLKTFEVSIEASLRLLEHLPKSKPAVAESGINRVETIALLRQAGFKGFLIGEYFMKQTNPAIAFAEFAKQLKATHEN
jgi:indole-3-glycerol phosphate synthase